MKRYFFIIFALCVLMDSPSVFSFEVKNLGTFEGYLLGVGKDSGVDFLTVEHPSWKKAKAIRSGGTSESLLEVKPARIGKSKKLYFITRWLKGVHSERLVVIDPKKENMIVYKIHSHWTMSYQVKEGILRIEYSDDINNDGSYSHAEAVFKGQ